MLTLIHALNLSFRKRFLAMFLLISLSFCVPLGALANSSAINLNTASTDELAEKLPGIGPAKARAIVEYRQQHGPFKTVDSVVEVKGIGPATLKKIKALLFIDKNLQSSVQPAFNNMANDAERQILAERERLTQNAVRAVVNIARRAETRHYAASKRE